MKKLFALALLCITPAAAQTTGPSQAALDDAVKLGTLATLAPLCGLRDEAWAFDLRRATIMDNTRPPAPTTNPFAKPPAANSPPAPSPSPKPRPSKTSPPPHPPKPARPSPPTPTFPEPTKWSKLSEP